MNFLVLKKLLEDAESFPTLVREAVVLLPANLVLNDVRELLLEHSLDSGLFFLVVQLWVNLEITLKVDGLNFRASTRCLLAHEFYALLTATQ